MITWILKRVAYSFILAISLRLEPPSPADRAEEIRSFISRHLIEKKVAEYWTVSAVHYAAVEIERIEREQKIPADHIIALVDQESGWQHWAKPYNTDGSRDYGLTQQNSYHYQVRCWRQFGHSCPVWQVMVPWVSLRLMADRLVNECWEYAGTDLRYACYNSNQTAIDGGREYLKSWRKKLKQIKGKI